MYMDGEEWNVLMNARPVGINTKSLYPRHPASPKTVILHAQSRFYYKFSGAAVRKQLP
jgi:hypothetical protein